eukprot:4529338-Lingulodinium_polyedra.AAC.1
MSPYSVVVCLTRFGPNARRHFSFNAKGLNRGKHVFANTTHHLGTLRRRGVVVPCPRQGVQRRR